MLFDVLLHSAVGVVNLGCLLCYLLALLVVNSGVLFLLGHALVLTLWELLSIRSRGRLEVFRHLGEDGALIFLRFLFVGSAVEVMICFIVLLCLLEVQFGFLDRRSRETIGGTIIVIDCASPSDLKSILSEVEDRNYLISLNLRFAANISIFLIEDRFPVPSIRYSIINNQP